MWWQQQPQGQQRPRQQALQPVLRTPAPARALRYARHQAWLPLAQRPGVQVQEQQPGELAR